MAVSNRLNANGYLQISGIFDEFTNNPATSGSLVFNGSSSYINTVLASGPGTTDFTLEAWAYPTAFASAASYTGIFGIVIPGNSLSGWIVTLGSSTIDKFVATDGSYSFFLSNNTAVTLNQWYHLALVQRGSTTTFYVNGIGVSHFSYNVTDYILYLGNNPPGTFFKGNISNFRYVLGTALYTKNFTPSYNPLNVVPGTQILLNTAAKPARQYFIDSSGYSTGFSTNTAVTTSTISPFTASGANVAVHRVTSNGSVLTTGFLDEVSLNGGSVARRINYNGNLQIAGIFDEVNKPV